MLQTDPKKHDAAHDLRGVRVAMLLDHAGRHDSRVVRAALTLGRAGADVCVFCANAGVERHDFEVEGIPFRAFAVTPSPWLAWRATLRRTPPVSTLSATPTEPAPGEPRGALRTRAPGSPVRVATLQAAPHRFQQAVGDAVRAFLPDVVHAHDLSTLRAGARLAREAGAKLIYDAHEYERDRAVVFSPVERRLRARLESRFIGQADAVVTVSDPIADALSGHYGVARPTVVLNAPRAARVRPLSRGQLGLPGSVSPNAPLVIYTGNMPGERGLDLAVRALAMSDTVAHLALVGSASESRRAALHALASAEGVGDRVHILPPVAPERVLAAVACADLAWLPLPDLCQSYRWALPNKLFQAVEAGVPVVATPLPEIAGFVRHFGCGVVAEGFGAEAQGLAIEAALKSIKAGSFADPRTNPDYVPYREGEAARRLLDVYRAVLKGRAVQAPPPLPHNRSPA